MSEAPAEERSALGATRSALARLAGGMGLAILAGVIYAPALHGTWLWDDAENLPDNPVFKSGQAWAEIWSGRVLLDYYPIKDTVQWVQWQLWGDHTLGYHLTNLALHVLSALLLWRILERLGLKARWAYVGAALWVVHPMAVGSVAWISEFKDALALPPLLAAVSCYLAYDAREVTDGPRSRALLWQSVGWFAVTMLCKSSALMFPACVLLYGWWKRRPWRDLVLTTIPFWLISLIAGLVAVEFQSHRAIAGDGTGLGGLSFRLSLASRALGFYLGHAVWPVDLSPVYLRWSVGGFAWCGVWLALAGLLFWRRKAPWVGALILGLGWFALNIFPALGVVGLAFMRFSWVMDHLAYVSLLGMVGLAAAGFQVLETRMRPLALGRAAAAVFLLAMGSRAYAAAYASSDALWTYTTAHQPWHWVGFDNLGALRIDQSRFQEAETLLRRAVELGPDVPDTHRNFAAVENQLKHPDVALAEVRRALQLRPDFAVADLDLATYLAQQGKLADSVPYWEATLRLVPPSADLRNRYALVLLFLGRYDAGLVQLKQSLAINPNWGPAEFNWALLLAHQGQVEEAWPHFERAARLLPNDAVVQKQVAEVRAGRGGR